MAKKPSPSLIAHKVINLANDLSSSEKRVSAMLIDSFNFKTGQCDPGVERMSLLLGLSERTITRATNSLAQKGYFKKTRNGGYFRRNAYEPNWVKFNSTDNAWSAHRKAARFRKQAPNLSSSPRHDCQVDGDTLATQTNPLKQIPETSVAAPCSRRSDHSPLSSSQSEHECEDGQLSFSADCTLCADDRSSLTAAVRVFAHRIGLQSFKAWFSDVRIDGITDADLILSTTKPFSRSRIDSQYTFELEDIIRVRVRQVSRVRIVLRGG